MLINRELIFMNSDFLDEKLNYEKNLSDYLLPKNSETLFKMFFKYDVKHHMEAYLPKALSSIIEVNGSNAYIRKFNSLRYNKFF